MFSLFQNKCVCLSENLCLRSYLVLVIKYRMPKYFDRKFCNLFSYRDRGIYPDEPVEIAEEAMDHPENEIHPHSD